jgi:hypothetical protein
MEKEDELKNSELRQHQEMDEMEGEAYTEDQFEAGEGDMDDQDMEGEGEMYDQDEQDEMHNPYPQEQEIRNTFYPPQNNLMGQGYGGALRPVSANVMKGGRKYGFSNKRGKKGGFAKGIEDEFDARKRPKNFLKEREGLYDDAIMLKKANNNFK